MKRTQLITTADLSKEEVDFLIEEAEKIRDYRGDDLKGKIVASLFFEPSTRTRLSFESAVHRLGGSVITVADAKSTSMKKGETLEDTIGVIEKYADVLVLRHPEAGAAERASKITTKPILNAGDGSNQHPTQALLDLYTFKREMGSIEGKTFAFVGDMKFGRTVHSILEILKHYSVKKIYFVTPDALKLPQNYLEMLKKEGVEYEEVAEVAPLIPELDLLYMTRIQEERFENRNEYEALKGSYVLTADLVRTGKAELKVLHPLPRVGEISTDVDSLPQAAYFSEAENGVYMRMALLKYVVESYYQ